MPRQELDIRRYIEPPQPRSIADQLADELEKAGAKNGMISSWLHRRREHYSAASIRATEARFAALEEALTRIETVTETAGRAQEAAIRSRIRQELAPLFLQVHREEVILALETRLARSRGELMLAERAALEAKHGLEASATFKTINYELGMARKTAQLAETREVAADVEEGDRKEWGLPDALRLRGDLRARGAEVPDSLNRLIESWNKVEEGRAAG